MKILNLKNSVALAALLTAGSLFGAANQIALTAQIGSKALVGFSDLSSASVSGETFVDDALNSLDFGTENAGDTHGSITRPIYVSTNNSAGVSMTISDNANSGSLKHSSGDDTIGMGYSFDGTDIALGTSFNVATSINAGSTSVGDMIFTPSASASDIAAGTYSTTLTVTIAAN